MSREISYTALILKRQPLGEADEIITLFTDSLGKVRLKSAGTKLSTSKLQYGLQPGFLVKIAAAGSGQLRRIIGVEVQQSFARLHQEQDLIQAWFVIAELLLKSTPDEQANLSLFNITVDCLNFLERQPGQSQQALLRFKIDLLKAVGLGVPPDQLESAAGDFDKLDNFVNEFLIFQLERDIKSQRFLEANALVS